MLIMIDPRYYQIVTLSILFLLQYFWSDFGPDIKTLSIAISSACLYQYVFCFKYKVPFDYKSPLITAFSLSILLRTSNPIFFLIATFIAISSKFLIRANNKHIFNPANLAIVVLLLTFPQYFWVSPGQWGSLIWITVLLICLAFLVLHNLEKSDISIYFLSIYSLLLLFRALWLGDPLSIPIHQIQSGSFLIFTFFMISDPITTPNHKSGRFIFALTTAIIAYILQFEFQIRESLFFALTSVCILTPWLDRIRPNERFQWRKT
jgi:Na+-transporting NADH:ubiquinone oxidoreductase subunit NqrB